MEIHFLNISIKIKENKDTKQYPENSPKIQKCNTSIHIYICRITILTKKFYTHIFVGIGNTAG